MKLAILLESTPDEYSTHLRRNLVRLFDQLGFISDPKPNLEEWKGFIAVGSPSEGLVDEVFRNLNK